MLDKPGDAGEVSSWAAYLAKNKSIFCLEYLETIWLWVLRTDFNFGSMRLDRCRAALRKIAPLEMPYKMLRHIMEYAESVRKWRNNVVNFADVRKNMSILDKNKDLFKNGLILINNAKG